MTSYIQSKSNRVVSISHLEPSGRVYDRLESLTQVFYVLEVTGGSFLLPGQ